ncbi:uncharacterized protein EV154DRAFT_476958 [Mucor mucedo]|uniref:uncharacterized protein n=1 Tax=Mucor mucedo TaxID=29922 RepID=UPI00221E6438|nr:uncharacterized protein EV154DRAFT_476958 [Mucor mucedo]KAI7895862.1 hypothetical protein EV154DRAFT_476958 [Mucor mucedo]
MVAIEISLGDFGCRRSEFHDIDNDRSSTGDYLKKLSKRSYEKVFKSCNKDDFYTHVELGNYYDANARESANGLAIIVFIETGEAAANNASVCVDLADVRVKFKQYKQDIVMI